jgi:hypothetical protein
MVRSFFPSLESLEPQILHHRSTSVILFPTRRSARFKPLLERSDWDHHPCEIDVPIGRSGINDPGAERLSSRGLSADGEAA